MSMTAIGGPESSRPWAAAPLARSGALALPGEASGGGLFKRFSTARQTRIGHEVLVRIEGLLARRRLYARRGPIRQDLPGLLVILEIGDHDLVQNLLVHGRIENRAHRLDPAVEVARHQVGRRDVDRGLRVRQAVPVAEAIDAAVLEEAADNRGDADAGGQDRG